MKRLATCILVITLFAGCYPSSPVYTETFDLVISNYDPNFDFQSKQTYAMPDNVVVITGEAIDDPDGDNLPDFVSDPYNNQILDAIRTNMSEYGWTEVDEGDNPDLVILPSAMSSTTIVYYYDYWYWDWYYGGYWGWYYPGYYPTYATSYTTGTLFIAMADYNGITPDQNIPVVWTGVVNGLLTGDVGSASSRIINTINQAFEQSTYLSH